METRYTYRHMKSTPALQAYLDEKLGKLSKYDDTVIDAEVVFAVEKRDQIVEVILKTKSSAITAVQKSEDMYASCDLVVEKLERQLRRYKEKLKNHH